MVPSCGSMNDLPGSHSVGLILRLLTWIHHPNMNLSTDDIT
ncbi:hypothetical protein JCM10914A_53500 [Paenibacillus sp. JCM 10914]